MGGSRAKARLATDYNSPAKASGRFSRSTLLPRQPVGKNLHAIKRRKRQVGARAAAAKPKGYVIVDKSVRGLLPNQTWEQARKRIDALFQKAGELRAVYVGSIKELPQLNLTDGVVECYENTIQASFGFRINVYNQLITKGHTISALKSRARIFNQPGNYSVEGGRAYTIKSIFQVPPPPFLPQLVCITYGVVPVNMAFALWGSLTLATIGRASKAEQESIGISLGNLIAHELRHQLALSETGVALGHSESGLGKDGADYKDPKNDFSDEKTIKANLEKLRSVQNKYELSRL